MLKHLDLFSGIGGFALAADRVFGEVEHIFCDNDKFCQQVLKKHWPTSKIYGDIKTLTADTFGSTGGGEDNERVQNKGRQTSNDWGKSLQSENRKTRSNNFESGVDLITGGFPCQPFSQAGRRKGTEDDRFLWPEMLRVIREFSPLWVIAENVRGIITINKGMVFEQVCLDLEGAGYEVQPFLIPACAVNAPHRRDRIWFVAHRTGERSDTGERYRKERCIQNDERSTEKSESKREGWECGTWKDNSIAEDTLGKRSGRRMEDSGQVLERQGSEIQDQRPSWEKNWVEVATELCGMDDGLPARMDGFELSASAHRRERLKSLGNSIVPQVAEEILKAIKKTYGTKTCLPSLQSRNNSRSQKESED